MDIRPLYKSIGTRQLHDVDAVIVGTGVKTASGNLTITPAGSSVVVDVNKNLSAGVGTGAVDFSNATGIFKTTAGVVTIGPNTVSVSGPATFSAAGTALAVTNNASVTGSLTVTSSTFANGGVERSAAGTLIIGTTANSTAITIGRVGQLTTFAGDISVTGTETVVGTTTFQSSATFDGDVIFGNAVTDTVEFAFSRIKNNIAFLKDQNHIFSADQSSVDTAGSNVTLQSGQGGTASVTGGGAGGVLVLQSGGGGNGTAGLVAGASGALTLRTGNAGTNGGGGGGASGNLTLDVGSPSGAALAGSITLGATAQSISIGQNGKTTTILGSINQSGGAVSLTGNGASNLTTTAGAITINGFSGVNLLGGTTPALSVNSTGTLVTVQAGATLETSGSGNINLPNNGSARFKIEGLAVTATVTAAALTTLTNGSNADSLHTHSGLGAAPSFTITAGENILTGQPIAVQDSTGAKGFKANATTGTSVLSNVTGFVTADITLGNTATIQLVGQMATPDARWDAFPLAADVGKKVYLDTTAGQLTLTAPVAVGSKAVKVGIVKDGGTGNVKIIIQIGDGVTNG